MLSFIEMIKGKHKNRTPKVRMERGMNAPKYCCLQSNDYAKYAAMLIGIIFVESLL